MEQGHGKNKLPEISKQLPRPLSPDNDIKMRVNANLRIEPSKEEMKTIEKQIKHDAHDHQIELLRQERKRVACLIKWALHYVQDLPLVVQGYIHH